MDEGDPPSSMDNSTSTGNDNLDNSCNAAMKEEEETTTAPPAPTQETTLNTTERFMREEGADLGSGLRFLKKARRTKARRAHPQHKRPSTREKRAGGRGQREKSKQIDDEGRGEKRKRQGWDIGLASLEGKLSAIAEARRNEILSMTAHFPLVNREIIILDDEDETKENKRTRRGKRALIEIKDDDERDRRAIWTADSHLLLRGKALRYIEVFSDTSLMLVHPAVIHETNLDWFLSNEEPTRLPSPLSLNMNIALCLGKDSYLF